MSLEMIETLPPVWQRASSSEIILYVILMLMELPGWIIAGAVRVELNLCTHVAGSELTLTDKIVNASVPVLARENTKLGVFSV
jgi:hypothetical protein